MKLCTGFYRDYFDEITFDAKKDQFVVLTDGKGGAPVFKPQHTRRRMAIDAEKIVAVQEVKSEAEGAPKIVELRLSVGGSLFVSNTLEESISLWLTALANREDTVDFARKQLDEAPPFSTEPPEGHDGAEPDPHEPSSYPQNPLPEPNVAELDARLMDPR